MKRDGECTSCWQEMPDYQAERKFAPDMVYDAVIIGAGITGITTALLLQTEGKSCLVTEARSLCFGTSGGTTAHLNTVLDTPYYTIKKNFGEENAKLVHEAANDAIQLIRKNVDLHRISCQFEEKTGFLFSPTEDQDKELEKIVDGSREVGVDIGFTDNSPIPVPFSSIARFSGQAQFHPAEYIYSLARAFESAGGTLLQYNTVNQVKEEGDLLHVFTERGIVKARNVVYATHTPPGINLLHLRLVPYRSYAMALRINGDYPDAVVYDTEDPYHYFRTQEIDGVPYLIAGGEDHKTGHEENTDKCFRQLESYLMKHFDIQEIKWKWSSQYYEPVDGLPYIGHLPMHPDNIYVATGFGGNGMIYGTLSGIIISDLILLGKSKYEKLFDPNRIKPIAGFKEFISAAADVVSNLIKKPFDAERIEGGVDLGQGEAKIVKFEGHKIALYKDEEGRLHGISPACNHMGCDINWNSAEKSWDCGCHGSRYNIHGEMITGPATKDQDQVVVEERVPHSKGAS